jgi:hypothetical protein
MFLPTFFRIWFKGRKKNFPILVQTKNKLLTTKNKKMIVLKIKFGSHSHKSGDLKIFGNKKESVQKVARSSRLSFP